MVGKPKPTNLKILNGNPGKRPLNKNEPKPDLSLLTCPEYLAKDKFAFDEWNRIVPELYKLGLLTNIDQVSIEIYCSQYSIYRQALDIINSEGLITTNIRNVDKAHPATTTAREAAKIIKSICSEFGLTPSSRGRISLPGENLDEEFEKLCDG